MTHLQFQLMDENRQFEMIDESGILLTDRREKFHTVFLYQVDSFFVEVYVHSHFNVPLKLKSFSSTCKLQPYVNALAIGHLCYN